jgi:hypothetical protein
VNRLAASIIPSTTGLANRVRDLPAGDLRLAHPGEHAGREFDLADDQPASGAAKSTSAVSSVAALRPGALSYFQ